MLINVVQKSCFGQPLAEALICPFALISQTEWTKPWGNKRVAERKHSTSRIKLVEVTLTMPDPSLFVAEKLSTEIAELNKVTRHTSMSASLVAITLLIWWAVE